MPDRSLDSLSSAMFPLACEWIARVTARGIAVMVVQTSRTISEHQVNLANGTSSARLSMHLPRSLRARPAADAMMLSTIGDDDKADAMDLAPYDVYLLSGADKLKWDARHPAWEVIGQECEHVGLRWGGRWLKPFDPGHGELVLPSKEMLVAEERARRWPAFRIT